MINFFDTLGLTGAFIVSTSNVPQIALFIKQKHAKGISISSTWLGFIGVLLRTIYLTHETSFNFIVLGPYFFALLCILITLYYCYFPKFKGAL